MHQLMVYPDSYMHAVTHIAQNSVLAISTRRLNCALSMIRRSSGSSLYSSSVNRVAKLVVNVLAIGFPYVCACLYFDNKFANDPRLVNHTRALRIGAYRYVVR